MGNRSGATVRRWATALLVAGMGVGGSANAILLDRGPDMVYDTVLDITWVRDASLCFTLGNCVNPDNSFQPGGMNWTDANAWAASLFYGGVSGWRLPYASVSAGIGPAAAAYGCSGDDTAPPGDESACRDNEMGYMFYYNLNGDLFDDKTGTQNAPPPDGQQLTGIESFYWSGTELDPGIFTDSAFTFDFASGFDGDAPQDTTFLSAWAVHQGDVGFAPEPASLLLLGLGALGLGWSRRRRQRN